MKKVNITKFDLIKKLSDKTGFSLNYSKKLINELINICALERKSGKFVLKNVGTFFVIKKKERIGRNPKTKEEFIISARKSIRFKASQNIINRLNV